MEHEIPFDVFYLDIDHTEEKKYFTFDSKRYPNPKKMI
jgi:alpha-glucosidase (family GH31 glycosyl hydrolase)